MEKATLKRPVVVEDFSPASHFKSKSSGLIPRGLTGLAVFIIIAMLLIIVGVQFFSVGLLGEMLVNNFVDEKEYQVKDRG